MFCVRAIDSEAKCRPVLSSSQPCIHDIGDERAVVHHTGQIPLMVIAGHGTNPGQIRVRWREYAKWRQIPGYDQILRRGRDDEIVKVSPEAARPRRR